MTEKRILNWGCGYDIHDDAVNVDRVPTVAGVVSDNSWRKAGHYDEIRLWHVLEHMSNPMDLMTEMYGVAKDGCLLDIRVPHGASDDAWGNPEHIRPWFPESMQIFGQGYWWREWTDYKADWRVESITLAIKPEVWDAAEGDLQLIGGMAERARNIVVEIQAKLRAVKPAREFKKGEKPVLPPIHVYLCKAVFIERGSGDE